MAYGIRHNFETFRLIGAGVKRVVAVGGGTKGGTWLQIVSDVTGVPQEVPAQTIGACYGDAFLAGLAAGLLTREHILAWVKLGRTILPERSHRGVYDAYYRDYLDLYDKTQEVLHRLSARDGG